MAIQTIGANYYEDFNNNYKDQSKDQAVYYFGVTVSSGGSADKTLSAIGALSGTSDFYLTRVCVNVRDFTETCAYNVLYGGDTLATLGKPGMNMTFNPGIKMASTTLTSTLQTIALVMSNAAATATAAQLLIEGYTK